MAKSAFATAPLNQTPPSVSGVFANGQELTVSSGDWLGTQPLTLTYQWQRCDSVKSAVLADSPVAYWRLGEAFGTALAADASGGSNTGTYTNAPTLGVGGGLSGDLDTAVRFDGVGSFVDVPDATSLKPASQFSLEAWIKTTASNGVIVDKPYTAGSQVSYSLSVASGKAQVKTQLTGGAYTAVSTSSVNDGQWHHLVGTFASSSLKIYVDGSLQATTTTSGSLQYSTQKLQIGRFDATGGTYLNGTLDEVVVYSTALSSTRVTAHHDAGTVLTGSGCSNITGATASFYALGSSDVGKRVGATVTATNSDGNASASSYATMALAAAPVNISLPLVEGTPGVQGQSLTADPGGWSGAATITYGYQWQRCSAYPSAVSVDGAAGFYRLGERTGTTAADTATGNNGSYIASPTLGLSGALGLDPDTAALFNGTSQYVQIPTATRFGSGDFTVEAWFKTTTSGTQYVYQSGTLTLYLANGKVVGDASDGTSSATLTTTGTYMDGVWHYAVYTRQGSLFSLYVDNGTPLTRTSSLGNVDSGGGAGAIGANKAGGNHFFNGMIDEVAVYKSALTAGQVGAHWADRTAPCTNIGGATGSTYTPVVADAGLSDLVVVTGANSAGSASARSLPVPVAPASAPVNTSPPTISGSPVVGQTLTAAVGSWNGGSSYTYQWQRCTAYPAALKADSPLGYWRLGDRGVTATAVDSVGFNDGVFGDGPLLGVPGALVNDGDTSVSFDKTYAQYVQLGHTVQFDSGSFTVEGWFKSTDYSYDLWHSGHGSNGDKWVIVSLDSTGHVQAKAQSDSTHSSSITSASTFNNGSWHYVAYTRSGSTFTLYLDGVSVGTDTHSLDNVDYPNALPVLGANDTLNGQFGTGFLDEWAAYNTALSSTRVSAHYSAGSAPCTDITTATSQTYTLVSGDNGTSVTVKVTDTNSVGPTSALAAPLPVSTSGSPVNTTLPAVTGTAQVGSTLSASTGSWLNSPTSYGYQWQRCQGYAQAVIADGAAGFWRLDEQTDSPNTAFDSTSGANNGTYTNSPTLGAGGALKTDPDTAVALNGSNQYIPLTSNVQFDTGAFTLEAWFKTKDTSTNKIYIWESGSSVRIYVTNGIVSADLGPTLSSGLKYNDDAWHQVVLTRSGANASLYIDGAASDSNTTVTTGDIDTGTTPPNIGVSQILNKYFNGSLDEVAYYRSALTATQVQSHYRPDNLGCTAISGASSATYTPTASGTPNDVGSRLRVQVTATNASGNTTATSKQTNTVLRGAPTLSTPADGAPLPLTQPVLSVNNTVTGATHYAFVVATDDQFSHVVSSSGWVAVPGGTPPATIDWTVGTALTEGKTYYWRVQARSISGGVWTTGWSTNRSFAIQSKRFGVRDSWAMWKAGPLAVNETTGNLVLSLPGPSYPTAVGAMGVSLAYNSLDATDNNGLGVGWTLAAGDSGAPPVKLIDHTLLTGEDKFAAAEIVWPDGGSSFYGQIGYAAYQSPLGDSSRLEPDKDGHGLPTGNGWTLYTGDGSFYRFGQADQTTGVAHLTSADVLSAKPGVAGLTYTYNGTELTQVTDGANTNRHITLTWNSISPGSCSDAIVCISGPDAVTWKYKGPAATPTATPLTTINDGTRNLAAFTYASNRLQKYQNANDLDPNNANISPGYNGTHAVTFAYTSSKLTSISEGPITGQTPSTSTPTFSYQSGPVSTDAAANGHSQDPTLRADKTRPAVGYTTLKAPCQQSGVSCGLPNTGATGRVYYDDFGHPLETVDPLGNTTQTGWNDHNQVLWRENPDGNPTDNTWDTVNNVLLFTQAPDPDGAGSLLRPVASYRYDETKIGTGCTPNDGTCGTETVFGGLKASYYKNTDFSSRPDALQTDANVDFNWTTSGPAALGGRNDNFAVRWTGNIAIATEGDYTFSVVSDGNTELAVGGVQASSDLRPYTAAAISDTTSHAAFAVSSQALHLAAGLHPIALEYTELTGASEIHLRWSCLSCNPAISDQVIPMTALRPVWLNQTSTVDPLGRIAFSHHADPASGNPDYTLAKLSDGTNVITSFSYDTYGRITQKVVPKGNASPNRSIDDQGNLLGSIDSHYATTWTYYASGEAAAPPSACGGSAVDQAQLLKSKSPYGIAATTTVYDSAGRPIATTNGKGATCNAYSSEGRISSSIAPGETQATTYTYDPAGQQRTATDTSGIATIEYDEAERVKRSVDSYGAEQTLSYDADGNTRQRIAGVGPLGSNPNYTTAYTYNQLDQLATVTDPANRQYSFYYCNCGRFKAIQYPNGTFSWMDTNPNGWATGVYNRHGTLSVPLPATAPADSQGSPLADYTYTYSQDGKKAEEIRTGGGLTTETTDYQYDNLGRLFQVTLPGGTLHTYTYDLDSNRTSIIENGVTTIASYAYDPSVTPGIDQLTSVTVSSGTTTYRYDSDGNTVARGTDEIGWDGRGRHNSGTFGGSALGYQFDPAGFRRERTGGSTSTWYAGAGLFAGTGTTPSTATLTNTDVSGTTGDLAHYAGAPTGSTTVTYIYFNGHGDLAAEADATGTRTADYTYDPFGALRTGATPANSTTERWVGNWDKKLDTSSSLIEMGARPYDPNTGRFYAPDPIEGGSLNAYDYAGQDPINNFDLDGNCFKDDATAYQLNKLVVGDHADLCRQVDELFDECRNGHYYGQVDNDAQAIAYCWRWVSWKLLKKNPDLWQYEHVRTHHWSWRKCAKNITADPGEGDPGESSGWKEFWKGVLYVAPIECLRQ